MGFASYQEDIVDRLTEKLDRVANRARRGSMPPSQVGRSVDDLREVIADARKLIDQLSLERDRTKADLVAKILSLGEKVSRLQAENTMLRRSNAILERDKVAFRAKSDELSRKVLNQREALRQQDGPSAFPSVAEPPRSTAVDQALLRYCSDPKPENKILPKLRGRFGDQILRKRIRLLVRHGRLQEIQRDGKTLYQHSPPDDPS